VQDIVERKRRRDLGSLRNPMDIMEGQYGLNDPSNPYLQGIDVAGLENMTSAREVPSIGGSINPKYSDRGAARWGPNRRGVDPWNRRQEGRYIKILGVDPEHTGVLPSEEGLLSPEQYDETMTHEVGHLGEQAVGNYSPWGREVLDRSHNMLYAPNVGGVTDPKNPYVGDRLGVGKTSRYDEGVPQLGIEGGTIGVDVDPIAAQERLLGANQKARSMIDQGLLGQDTESSGSEGFLAAPLIKEGVKAIEKLVKKKEPTSIKEAQAQGKSYFMKDGNKQLAVTGEQLAKFKKTDLYDSGSKKSALSQWANIANKEGGMKKLFPPEKKELKIPTPKADQKAASETAFNKIAEWEGGYQSSTFDDPGDKSNRIGYGRKSKKGEVTTKAKEDKWLKSEIDEIGKYLDKVITADLTPNQRAALTSLVFNVGRTSFKGSKALAALNAGDMDEFRKQAFSKEKGWVKSGGKRMDGLVNRRKKEEDLFFG
jgi:lysozyme